MIDLDGIAHLGHASDVVVDEPADRVELILVIPFECGVEVLEQIIHIGSAVYACIVLAERRDGVLRLYDVLAERIPSWEQLAVALLEEGDREVEFHFASDRLGVSGVQRRPLGGNHPFVRPGFPLAQPVFPYTARA